MQEPNIVHKLITEDAFISNTSTEKQLYTWQSWHKRYDKQAQAPPQSKLWRVRSHSSLNLDARELGKIITTKDHVKKLARPFRDGIILEQFTSAYGVFIPGLSSSDSFYIHGFSKLDESYQVTNALGLQYQRQLQRGSTTLQAQVLYLPNGMEKIQERNAIACSLGGKSSLSNKWRVGGSATVFKPHDATTLSCNNAHCNLRYKWNDKTQVALEYKASHSDSTNIALIVRNKSNYNMKSSVQVNAVHASVNTSMKNAQISEVGVQLCSDMTVLRSLHLLWKISLNHTMEHDNIVDVDIISRHSIASLSHVSLGIALGSKGIAWKIHLEQDTHTISVPIVVSDDISSSSLLQLVALPIACLCIFKFALYNPWKTRSEKAAILEKYKAFKQATESERSNAEKELASLQEQIAANKQAEEAKQGLVILFAQYGDLSSTFLNEFAAVSNVTGQLQFFVKDSTLSLPAYPKHILNGFYDPCPNHQSKNLLIRYMYKNVEKEIVVKDNEAVNLP